MTNIIVRLTQTYLAMKFIYKSVSLKCLFKVFKIEQWKTYKSSISTLYAETIIRLDLKRKRITCIKDTDILNGYKKLWNIQFEGNPLSFQPNIILLPFQGSLYIHVYGPNKRCFVYFTKSFLELRA